MREESSSKHKNTACQEDVGRYTSDPLGMNHAYTIVQKIAHRFCQFEESS